MNGIADDVSFVGRNASSLVAPGQSATYTFYAEKEGTYLVTSLGATWGGEGSGGHVPSLLFGAVNVQPRGAAFLRSQVTEEDLALASADGAGNPMRTPDGHPIVNYDALYPVAEPWITEGKAGTPVLRMVMNDRLFHTDLNAIVAYDNNGTLGNFPPSTYPLESIGKSNPAYPNRLEPFREYTAIFHDETDRIEAFPGFFGDRILGYTLHGVGDVFMINYGSGGVGSEVIANRLGVGPMHDCLDCKFEEFFLSSYTVGDPAMVVDKPANFGLETVRARPAGAPRVRRSEGAGGVLSRRSLQRPPRLHQRLREVPQPPRGAEGAPHLPPAHPAVAVQPQRRRLQLPRRPGDRPRLGVHLRDRLRRRGKPEQDPGGRHLPLPLLPPLRAGDVGR